MRSFHGTMHCFKSGLSRVSIMDEKSGDARKEPDQLKRIERPARTVVTSGSAVRSAAGTLLLSKL